MNLSKENKLDAVSGFLAIVGVALTLLASELSLPILMGIGATVVVTTAVVRVSHFRATSHLRRPRPFNESHPL